MAKTLLYETCVSILNNELLSALGCTEPSAIAYAAALAKKHLNAFPQSIDVFFSGNLLKNCKSVIVPNSQGMKGIAPAAVLGIVGGNSDLELEVLSEISPEDIAKAKILLNKPDFCKLHLAKSNEELFYIKVIAYAQENHALVEVTGSHTNINRIEYNGKAIFANDESDIADNPKEFVADKGILTIKGILEFGKNVDLSEIEDVISKQVSFNSALAQEGLKGNYGNQIGKTILHCAQSNNPITRIVACSAAASDARMGGSSFPAVINSGSGNQGIAVSVPLIEYGQVVNASREELIRALAVANLISIHQKQYIGNLSAYCGAVSAACGAVCGIAFLNGEEYELIANILTNTLCTIGGMVCDGAKPSCASKIASAVSTGINAYEMAKVGQVFQPGEGLVGANIEETIQNIGRMARQGMKSTDNEIINIMMNNSV